MFTTRIAGRLFFSISSQTLSSPTSRPPLADAKRTAPSITSTELFSSDMKSRNPGTSRQLILQSFHCMGASEVYMDIPRFFSSSSKSMAVFPSSTRPILSVTPVLKRIVSIMEVFPLPP